MVRDEMEQRWRDVGDFIREQRRMAELSLRRLSDMAGVSNPYLSQIERGLRRPSAEILQQIARALEISAETLYVRAGFLEEDAGAEADLRQAIRADRILTETQKATLIRVYESFLLENGVRPEDLARRSRPPSPPSPTAADGTAGADQSSSNGGARAEVISAGGPAGEA
jgi:transcriptional regulator with XRE-family HTH domain